MLRADGARRASPWCAVGRRRPACCRHPHSSGRWPPLRLCAALRCSISWRVAEAGLAQRWLALAAPSIAGFQCLSMCYAAAFPYRSGAQTGRGRAPAHRCRTPSCSSSASTATTLSWYLRRPIPRLRLRWRARLRHGARRRLGCGIAHNSWSAGRTSTRRWPSLSLDAYDALRAAVPGRIVARDARSIVVSR